MATRKIDIPQKDFGLGEVRPEAIERDDTDLIARSLWKCENAMPLSTGALENRPGSFFLRRTVNRYGFEIEPSSGVRFILAIRELGLDILNADGTRAVGFIAPWSADADVWVNAMGDTTLMGAQDTPPHALVYDNGVFTFGEMGFAEGVGDSLSGPYYRFRRDITLEPSARTGSITLTTSKPFFHPDYIGQRIRYVEREILITAVSSSTSATGTVIEELTPTKRITVASTSGFRVGEVVEQEPLGGQGVIRRIPNATTIDVVVTSLFAGFEHDSGTENNLIGPSSRTTISAVADAPSPESTFLWDEPLWSPRRGYPGSCDEHGGRVIFCDFPQAPNVVALTAAGTLNDFKVGTNDDDAIIDTVAVSESTRVRHVVSAEDLLILTSRGVYYQQTRDGSVITPASWAPIRFDEMGVSRVRPVKVFDGVVFLGVNGQNLMGAVLQGDINKAWVVIPLSDFHSHTLRSPVRLGATDNDSERPERFVFIVNGDGSATIMKWERGPAFDGDAVGFFPWSTTGSYKSMFMAFGEQHQIVERTIAGVTVNHLERSDPEAALDCATGFTTAPLICLVDEEGTIVVDELGNCPAAEVGAAGHLAGHTATVYLDGWDFGDYLVDEDGFAIDENGQTLTLPESDANVQVGLPFTTTLRPWPRRSIEHGGKRRQANRIIRLGVHVQDTIAFSVNGEPWGGYAYGDIVTDTPPRRTDVAYFHIMNREAYQQVPIIRDRPGPFRLTALSYKVSV